MEGKIEEKNELTHNALDKEPQDEVNNVYCQLLLFKSVVVIMRVWNKERVTMVSRRNPPVKEGVTEEVLHSNKGQNGHHHHNTPKVNPASKLVFGVRDQRQIQNIKVRLVPKVDHLLINQQSQYVGDLRA